jgi:hypothetical protein
MDEPWQRRLGVVTPRVLRTADSRDSPTADGDDHYVVRVILWINGTFGVGTGDRLVAVQTVLVEQYWDELRHGFADQGIDLFHVVLDVEEPALLARIAADEVDPCAEPWRVNHIAADMSARPWMTAAADLVVDTTGLTARDAAAQILEALKQEAGGTDGTTSPGAVATGLTCESPGC